MVVSVMLYDLKLDESSLKIFESLGVELEMLFRDAGMPHRVINNHKFQLTAQQYKDLLGAIDNHIKPDFIVAVSEIDVVTSFNPEFFAGLCAENGLECLKRIAKYKQIIAPIQMKLENNHDELSISYAFNDGTKLPNSLIMHAQINILSILRRGTGIDTLMPTKIMSNFDYPSEVRSYFKDITFIKSEENKIVFSMVDLDKPFITKNNRMWELLENELNQRLRDMEMDLSFTATVRRTLVELLPSGASDVDKISNELGISKRTLQRRLKDEHTSFNEQLNHTRELMVRNYLKMDMTLDEIAFLVSYSDAKSLSRAFKLWTGMNITEYKLEL